MIDTYGIHHWRITWSSYRRLAWVRLEPMTSEFCSDALTDWTINPWVRTYPFCSSWRIQSKLFLNKYFLEHAKKIINMTSRQRFGCKFKKKKHHLTAFWKILSFLSFSNLIKLILFKNDSVRMFKIRRIDISIIHCVICLRF